MNSFVNEKRIFVILLLLIGIISIPLLLFQQRSSIKNYSQPTPTPTKPKIPAFTEPISLTSVSPKDGETEVSIAPKITIVFSRPLSPDEQKAVSLSLSPESTFQPLWTQNATSVYFSPVSALSASSTYAARLSYGQKTYLWSFTTKSDSTLSNTDYQNLQTVGDEAFSQQQLQIKSSYPWISKLPINAGDYFTSFDFNSNSFITKIYYPIGTTPNQTTIDSIKKSVTTTLKSYGIDTTKYKFIWTPTPVHE